MSGQEPQEQMKQSPEISSDDENRPTDEDEFSETDAPSDLNANESNFNETEAKELASKFGKVSLGEREAALFDIHGVAHSLAEDPEMLSMTLKELNEMLTSMICWKQASAFKLAESQDPEYTRSHKLLLMFLRCENFNTKAAATRVTTFFQHKLRLFGPERLCHAIGQSDLDEEDFKCLSAGYLQFLPRRDHVGRAQLIYFPPFALWDTHDNAVSALPEWRGKLRSLYYLCMALLRDEETQKKGIVLIVHSVGSD
eukprot:scaffold22602_cov154-Cylindrotheca_fusiformis.AAC.1